MPYTHILVAVDLTEECREVIQRAQALANSSNAKLSLINVVEPMAMAAVAAGADGLMIEVHNQPQKALCDGQQSITPALFHRLMEKVTQIHALVRKNGG